MYENNRIYLQKRHAEKTFFFKQYVYFPSFLNPILLILGEVGVF